jgi:hypothetical protein
LLEELAGERPVAAAPVDAGDVPDAVLSTIFSGFTMESEREVFRAVLPGRAPAALGGSEGQAQSCDEFFL